MRVCTCAHLLGCLQEKPGTTSSKAQPFSYAVIDDKPQPVRDFYNHHEGVHLFSWQAGKYGYGVMDRCVCTMLCVRAFVGWLSLCLCSVVCVSMLSCICACVHATLLPFWNFGIPQIRIVAHSSRMMKIDEYMLSENYCIQWPPQFYVIKPHQTHSTQVFKAIV